METINDLGGENVRRRGEDYARPPRDTLIRRLTGGSWLSHYQELSGLAARTGRDGTGRDATRRDVVSVLRADASGGAKTIASFAKD